MFTASRVLPGVVPSPRLVPVLPRTRTSRKNAVFDLKTFGSCKNRRFGRTYRLHHQGGKNQRPRNSGNSKWQLKIEGIRSSELSGFTRAARSHISEDCILHIRRGNLKSNSRRKSFNYADFYTLLSIFLILRSSYFCCHISYNCRHFTSPLKQNVE
jgi:hypothetical protein